MEAASGQRVTENNRDHIETVGIAMSTWESNPTYTHETFTHDGRVVWRQTLLPGPVTLESEILTPMFSKCNEVLTRRSVVQIVGLMLYIDRQAFTVVRVESPKSADRVTFVASLLSSGTRSRFTIVSPRWMGVLRWLSSTQKYAMKQLGTLKPSETLRKIVVEQHAGGFASRYSDECWYYSGSWQNAKTLTFRSHAFQFEIGTGGAYQRKIFHLAANTLKPRVRDDAEHQYLDCLCQTDMVTCESDKLWLSFRWKKPENMENKTEIPERSPSTVVDETSAYAVPTHMREWSYWEFKRVLAVVSQSISSKMLLDCHQQDAQVDRRPFLLRKTLFAILFNSRHRVLWRRCRASHNYAALMMRMMKTFLKYLMPADIM